MSHHPSRATQTLGRCESQDRRYPVDDAGIDISHLNNVEPLVSGTAIDPNHVSHPPGTFGVSDNHRHACLDVKNGDPTWALQRRLHDQPTYPLTSTAVLLQE